MGSGRRALLFFSAIAIAAAAVTGGLAVGDKRADAIVQGCPPGGPTGSWNIKIDFDDGSQHSVGASMVYNSCTAEQFSGTVSTGRQFGFGGVPSGIWTLTTGGVGGYDQGCGNGNACSSNAVNVPTNGNITVTVHYRSVSTPPPPTTTTTPQVFPPSHVNCTIEGAHSVTKNANQQLTVSGWSSTSGLYNYESPGSTNPHVHNAGSTLTISYPNAGDYAITVASPRGGTGDVCFVHVNPPAPQLGGAFSGWQAVGGASVAGTPALVKGPWIGPNVYFVYARGTDGNLYTTWVDDGTAHPWQNLGMPATAVGVASDPTGAARFDRGVDVFVRGSNNLLYRRYVRSGVWSAWELVSNDVVAAGSNPSVVSDVYGEDAVFWRSSNNQLKFEMYNDGFPEAGHKEGPFTPGPGGMSGDPTAVVSRDGRIDVFWNNGGALRRLGSDHWWTLAGASANPNGITGVQGRVAAAAIANSGRIDLAWRGSDNSLLHATMFTDGRGFFGPDGLGGFFTSDPAVVSRTGNDFTAYALGSPPQGMFENSFVGGYTGFVGLGGSGFVGSPTVVSTAANRMHLVVIVGTTLYTNTWRG